MKKILTFIVFALVCALGIATVPVHAAAIYDHEVILDMNGGDYLHHDIDNFGDKLDSDEPLTVLAIGDSTSDETDEWYYLMGEQLAANNPQYSINYRQFDNVSGMYGANVNIRYGTDGDGYATFDGEVGNYISSLYNSNYNITGDIELIAKIEPEPGYNTVVAKKSMAGQNSFQWVYYLSDDELTGKITLSWSEDGTTSINQDSGAFDVDGTKPIWIRTTFDVDDGVAGYEIVYYYSLDGLTWTEIETDTLATGATSIFNSSSVVEVGSYFLGTYGNYNGKIYNVSIKDGIDGDVVVNLDFDLSESGDTKIEDVDGNTWVIHGDTTVGNGAPGLLLLNGSIGGYAIADFDDELLSKISSDDVDLTFISLGHNETDDIYKAKLENFIYKVESYNTSSKIVLTTQNPQKSPRTETEIIEQKNRMDQVKLVAQERNIAFIDTYTVLSQDLVTYILDAGVHPTDAGQIVWSDVVSDMLNMRKGSGFSELKYLVEDGELIVEPDEPVKDGATFVGWFTDSNLTDEWNFATDKVQDDMTLYAKYSDSINGGTIIGSATTATSFLGLEWYYWVGIAVVGGYFLFVSDSGRKMLGLKKLKKGR